jgi:uncharacterized membrane protein
MRLIYRFFLVAGLGLLVGTGAVAYSSCGEVGKWYNIFIPDEYYPPVTGPLGFKFDAAKFYKACNIHDRCYETLGTRKMDCDREFYHNLEAECGRAFNTIIAEPAYQSCVAAARIYYEAVAGGGDSAFTNAQKEAEKHLPYYHVSYKNLYSEDVWVAVRHYDSEANRWVSKGEWKIGPGQTAFILNDDAKIRNEYIYFHARNAGGAFWGEPDQTFDVNGTERPFYRVRMTSKRYVQEMANGAIPQEYYRIHFVNTYNEPIWVAAHFLSGATLKWETKGYWRIEPGQQAYIIGPGDKVSNRIVYFHAHLDSGAWWGNAPNTWTVGNDTEPRHFYKIEMQGEKEWVQRLAENAMP